MLTSSFLPALLLATGTPSGVSDTFSRIRDTLFYDPFAGIHRLAPFDYAIMIPYFLVLAVLSLYGLHRFEMIRGYWKHRKRLHEAPPPTPFELLPPVTVQLPIYNERYVVERLLESASKIDYPRALLQIQVLDDSTDETHAFTERLVGEYRAAGVPIEYIHRNN